MSEVAGGSVKKNLHDWEAYLVASADEGALGVDGYKNNLFWGSHKGKSGYSFPKGFVPYSHVTEHHLDLSLPGVLGKYGKTWGIFAHIIKFVIGWIIGAHWLLDQTCIVVQHSILIVLE